jgi:hypothetical protein
MPGNSNLDWKISSLMKQSFDAATALITLEQLDAYTAPNATTQTTTRALGLDDASTTTTTTTVKRTTLGSTSRSSTSTYTGKVTSSDIENDSLWLTPITVGSPGQVFLVDCNTGSAEFWLLSTLLLPAPQGSASHTYYNPTGSSSAKPLSGYTWSITYGDGSSASGKVATDSINLAGLVIKNQAVEYATQCSSQFMTTPGDGLCVSFTPLSQQTLTSCSGPGIWFTQHLPTQVGPDSCREHDFTVRHPYQLRSLHLQNGL